MHPTKNFRQEESKMKKSNSEKDENASQSTLEESQVKLKLGGDSRRIKMLKDINELSHIPEFEYIFSNVLDEIKKKYPEKIDEYRDFKKNLEKEFGEKIEEKGKSKKFYFELNRVKDPGSSSESRWELGDFKLKVKREIANMIFSELIARIDQYEPIPSRIQEEIVYSYPLNTWFQINFTKSSDKRVVGFVKVLQEDLFVKNRSRIVRMTVKPNQVIHREKLLKLMEDNPEVSKAIYFALKMRDYSIQ
jgi:hypothetical protein